MAQEEEAVTTAAPSVPLEAFVRGDMTPRAPGKKKQKKNTATVFLSFFL